MLQCPHNFSFIQSFEGILEFIRTEISQLPEFSKIYDFDEKSLIKVIFLGRGRIFFENLQVS
jgi:hypothetical protein